MQMMSFNNQTKYESGLIVPYGDDLLLAFAKLDINGKGYFPTREAYLNSLAVMWSEIYKYNQQKRDTDKGVQIRFHE